VTDAPRTSAFAPGRALAGAVLGLAGHAVAFGAGFLAARLTAPSAGGGFEDIGAAVGAFLLVEILIGLTCLVTGTVLYVKGRRDFGLGLVAGWVVGVIAAWVLVLGA
jgi:hypothetical protein